MHLAIFYDELHGYKEMCRNCRWWELLKEDEDLGRDGTCMHPLAEAQHIAHTREVAPDGLFMPGASHACRLFEKKGGN